MDSWVAIDFETANERRGSPCAVALCLVEDNQPSATDAFYVRPPDFRFSGFNMALHGVTPAHCAHAPRWPEALERIIAFVGGRPLVAHNASFDTGVIRDACDMTELVWPDLTYACTLVKARRTWRDLVSYSLPFVVAAVGGEEWTHHDPVGDAMAAARVATAAMRAHGVSTLDDLLIASDAMWGHTDSSYWRGCRAHAPEASRTTLPTAAPDVTFDASHPLFERTVVFTGELAIVRREAQQLVVDVGGHVATSVSKKVDILITGYQDLTRLAPGYDRSEKFRHAEELRAKGYPVEILSERDLQRLLRDDGAVEGHRRTAI